MRRKSFCALLLCVFLLLMFLTACKSNKGLKDLQLGLLIVENSNDYYLEEQKMGFYAMVKSMGGKQVEDGTALLAENQIVEEKATAETVYEKVSDMVQTGCKVIFILGQGIEDYIVQAATENLNVDFCLVNGEQAHFNQLPNYHTFTFRLSESSYIDGVTAGLKLRDLLKQELITEEMLQIGYLAAADDAQNISAFSAFYLGAKSLCPKVVMKVLYLQDQTEDDAYKATRALIANNCVLIAQHMSFEGVRRACEENGKFYFEKSATEATESDLLIADIHKNWEGVYEYAVRALMDGKDLPSEWSVGSANAEQYTSGLNRMSFSTEGYNEARTAIEETYHQIEDGSLHVFDTATWTVDGKQVASTSVDTYQEAFHEEEFIKDGYFAEYDLYALPKFCFVIDGITELNPAENPAENIYR